MKLEHSEAAASSSRLLSRLNCTSSLRRRGTTMRFALPRASDPLLYPALELSGWGNAPKVSMLRLSCDLLFIGPVSSQALKTTSKGLWLDDCRSEWRSCFASAVLGRPLGAGGRA